MNIIGRDILDKYKKKQKNNVLSDNLDNWLAISKDAKWKGQNDIRKDFTKVSFLPHNRVVFNIVGNNYRLSVIVIYVVGAIRIEWIGTHKEYDRLDLTKKLLKFD